MGGKYDETGIMIYFSMTDSTIFEDKINDLQEIYSKDNDYILQYLKGVEFSFTSYDPSLDIFVTTIIVSF
jgi:hypothetical protein